MTVTAKTLIEYMKQRLAALWVKRRMRREGRFREDRAASHGQQVLIYHEPDTESNDEDNGT
jgi:hypothetical protein